MYQLSQNPNGSFFMISLERGLRWRLTSASAPEREARLRAAGAELDDRQAAHAADGSYGEEAAAWARACAIVGVPPRFAWTGIVNSLGDHGSVTAPVKPYAIDADFVRDCAIVSDLVAPVRPALVGRVIAATPAVGQKCARVDSFWDELMAREKAAEKQLLDNTPSRRIVGGTRRRRNARRRINK